MPSFSVWSLLALYWPYALGPALTLLSQLHTRLARWPVLQVLVKHVGGLPMLKMVALDIARVVVAEWGGGAEGEAAPVPTSQTVPTPTSPPLTDAEKAALAAALTPKEQEIILTALAQIAPAPPKTFKNGREDGGGQ